MTKIATRSTAGQKDKNHRRGIRIRIRLNFRTTRSTLEKTAFKSGSAAPQIWPRPPEEATFKKRARLKSAMSGGSGLAGKGLSRGARATSERVGTEAERAKMDGRLLSTAADQLTTTVNGTVHRKQVFTSWWKTSGSASVFAARVSTISATGVSTQLPDVVGRVREAGE